MMSSTGTDPSCLAKRCAFRRLVLPALLFFIADSLGCSQSDTRPPSRNISQSRPVGPAETADRSRAGTSREVVLLHDIELIRPLASQQCVFTIENTSDERWTIDEIRRTCTCTVVDVTRDVIAPGEAADLAIQYRAPDQATDDERVIAVSFQEPVAPQFRLIIKACVRPVVTINPSEVAFSEVLPGAKADRAVMLMNYGDRDWNDLTIVTGCEWLTATAHRLLAENITGEGAHPPRQAWRLELSADSAALAFGSYRTNIKVTPREAQGAEGAMLVSLTIPSPMRAVPDRLFLGYVSDGKPVTRILTLALANELAMRPAAEIEATSDLETSLSFAWAAARGRLRYLNVTFDPAGQSGRVDGTISLTIPGSRPVSLKIPVTAVITPRLSAPRAAQDKT